MQDDIYWKLSLLLDDELEPKEAIALLEQIYQDAELLNKWYGYYTIRQVLRTGGGIRLQPEFLERVRVALSQERAFSDLSEKDRWVFSFKRFNFGRWTVPLAMAMGVAIFLLLISAHVIFSPSAPQKVIAKSSLSSLKSTPEPQVSNYSQLEDYYFLVHSEDSLYLAGPQHVLGYARIVSHGR